MRQLKFYVIINGKERKMWFTSQYSACEWAIKVFRDEKVKSLLLVDPNNNIYFEADKDDQPPAGLA